MSSRIVFVVGIACSQLLFAQRVSFGFVGGTNLTHDYPLYRSLYSDENFPGGLTTFDLFSDSHSFIWGVSAEIHLTDQFSLEGNALHRNLRVKGRTVFPDGSQLDGGESTTTTWEYPILLKYRAPQLGLARPFIEAGPSFRTRHNPTGEPSQFGGTIGIGAEFHMGRFRVSPTVRYTRWQYDGPFPRFATKQDQIELLTGISYATSVPSWKVGGKKLRFGLIGGTPITGGLGGRSPFTGAPTKIDERQGYIAGLAAEMELSPRFSVEADGLYRPFRANTATLITNPGIPAREFRDEFTVLTWQFPVLAKYRLRPQTRTQPVIEAGPSFRLSGNTNGYNPSLLGATAGIGLETSYRSMKISPMLRYMHWAKDSHPYYYSFGPRTAPNQVEFLVSLTF